MKTELDKPHTRCCGVSRAGMLILVTAIVVVCGLVLLVWKQQAVQVRPVPQVHASDVNESATYQDPNHRFNLSIPDGWTVDASIAEGPGAMTLVTFHSPADTGLNTLAVWNHAPTPGFSARAWAEQEVEAGARIGKKDGTVRPDSWTDLEVGGRPAASLITDFAMDSQRYTIYHVYVMTDTSSLKFRFMIPSKDFATIRPVVDTLLGGFEFN